MSDFSPPRPPVVTDRRAFLRLVPGALALGAGLAARGGPAQAAASAQLNIGNQKGGLRSLIEASGNGGGLPFDLRWSEFQSAAPILESINAGALDVGYTGDFSVLTVFGNGAPIRAIAAVRNAPAGQAIVVRDSSSIRSVADLRGKTVAGTRGGWGEFLIKAALKEAGVDPREVNIRFMAPPEALPAFSGGRIDAWAIWDPFISQVVLRAGARVLRDGQGLTPSIMLLVASQAAIASKRAQLAAFRDRVRRGIDWINGNIPTYAAYNSRLTGMPEEVLLRAFDVNRASNTRIDDALIAELQQAADQATAFGVFERKIDVAPLLDVSFQS